uniref:Uncharacterized protein n=1 Tax=Arundo donax TaxID=35708 RepID=A0A0A8YA52_ARUDO
MTEFSVGIDYRTSLCLNCLIYFRSLQSASLCFSIPLR